MTPPISALDGPWWPLLSLILFAALPTGLWRVLAVLFARRIDERSEAFIWVKTVASALVMSVVAGLVLNPSGALGAVPLAGRLAALGAGLAAFFATRRSLAMGVIVGEAVLVTAAWLATRA